MKALKEIMTLVFAAILGTAMIPVVIIAGYWYGYKALKREFNGESTVT